MIQQVFKLKWNNDTAYFTAFLRNFQYNICSFISTFGPSVIMQTFQWLGSLLPRLSVHKLRTNSCALRLYFYSCDLLERFFAESPYPCIKKVPSVSPSSLLSSPAYDEQRQALLRVLRVWHHNRRQAEAVADRGEGFNMLMHNSKNHIQGFHLLQLILLCIKNNVFFGLKTLSAYFTKPKHISHSYTVTLITVEQL